ncbi:FlgD immunoglobulin-like domain containing protein [Candidatus Eisenbacteria bacterium]|uniref:FlgD immunoglobulin-like domain containing protein n=1 Tax=Eiseniibacteriota bacterium TaxID=2212470 RepID=A0ABV6YJ94_UNCEI
MRRQELTFTALATMAVVAFFLPGFAEAQLTTTGPVPPPGIDRGLREPTRSQVVLTDVPAYIWQHGCGPTAEGMVIGYWDGHGFPDLVVGEANTQTPDVNAMIADDSDQPDCELPDGDHYQDYSCPIDYGTPIPDRSETGGAHASNCVADFMATSRSSFGNCYGWSYLAQIPASYNMYVEYVSDTYIHDVHVHSFAGFTWDEYKAEIDAGRPFCLLVDTDGNGSTDHFVTAIGYDDETFEYGCRDTWDRSVHWFEWRGMSAGNSWGIHSAITYEISHPGVCCLDDACEPLASDDCTAAGGIYMDGMPYCDPNPCINACCHVDSCRVVTAPACLDAGGEWQVGVKTCDPNPCFDFVCCIDHTCQLLKLAECAAQGGEWLEGVVTCDPDPCAYYACCNDTECHILKYEDCVAVEGEWIVGALVCSPNPCPAVDLSGGILMVHAPPGLQWSNGLDFCQQYYDEHAISSTAEQITSIEPDTATGESSVWYVIAAWEDIKETCSVQFGLADYDEEIFSFREASPCNAGGLEISSSGWPGAGEGTLVIHENRWWGNYIPVYLFGGYGYYEGEIPLGPDETQAIGGFYNCDTAGIIRDPVCYGSLGIFTSGNDCYLPEEAFACCIDSVCTVLTANECDGSGGIFHAGLTSCEPNPCDPSSGFGPEAAGPVSTWLFTPQPNPFTSSTILRYQLGAAGDVEIGVYDASGRLVRRLHAGATPSGPGLTVWDGRDKRGARASPGTYFFRLSAGGKMLSQRVVVLE